ncbi:MAG TPA: alpha-N-arabinofuranosidase [Anaeromyxobacter sp.]|nr:alpha-N-arabinofuranosidase [Anaeromyxobacter sp.]
MRARIRLEKEYRIAEADPRLFGAFVEHLGRCVYGGVYEPGHPHADPQGLRRDVVALVKELGVPVVRYPGGNFVSGFRWEDSVGPAAERPRRLDLAWRSTEPNLFGLNEFVAWTRAVGTSPMMALNLGTRGTEAALDLLEYCNHPGGSAWSDLRRRHGFPEPHGIKLWCLGNELDGPWQVGQKSPLEYGRLARETAKAMKLLDPTLELVACGSSHGRMETFPEWEATVLEHAYDYVDYLSLHSYYQNHEDDPAEFLASSAGMDAFIRSVVATADYVKARRRSHRTIHLSFDEWNVWFHSMEADRTVQPWTVGPPLLEDVYTLEDALVVGTLLITLLKHADRVKIACIAQLVNVIAPIMTAPGGPAWRQTIFYPFMHASRFGRGTVLDLRLDCPGYESKKHGPVPYLEATAVDDGRGTLTLLLVNRSVAEPVELEVQLGGYQGLSALEHQELRHPDRKAANTRERPDAVQPRPAAKKPEVEGDRLRLAVAPFSWNVVRVATRA